MMFTGISLYKRTADLSRSAPRMTPDWDGFKAGLEFEVPLHDNNQQYSTVVTGLIKVQTDTASPGLTDWITRYADPDLPTMRFPDTADSNAINGCPLSLGAHRTYFLDEGDYFLETQGASIETSCSHFNVKMLCSGGAVTASSADSDPLGFSVDAKTGAITGTPERARVGSPYRMRLRAVDAADQRATVNEWSFTVANASTFSLNPLARWGAQTLGQGRLQPEYHVGETHLLPKPAVPTRELLLHPARGAFEDVNYGLRVYQLSVEASPGNPDCAAMAGGGDTSRVISALTDVATGEGAINIQCEGNYSAALVVRDAAGAEVTVRSWDFVVKRRDVDLAQYVTS